MQHIRITLTCIATGILLANIIAPSIQAQETPRIQVVYMGGSDCPPCVAWRAKEYPKLASTEVFKRIRYSHVEKVIRSSVPPSFFLPKDVKPFKEKLDHAANGISGSPHTVILVDDEVFDYKFGTYSASELEARLLAIESREEYPFPRCTRRGDNRNCAVLK